VRSSGCTKINEICIRCDSVVWSCANVSRYVTWQVPQSVHVGHVLHSMHVHQLHAQHCACVCFKAAATAAAHVQGRAGHASETIVCVASAPLLLHTRCICICTYGMLIFCTMFLQCASSATGLRRHWVLLQHYVSVATADKPVQQHSVVRSCLTKANG
jgi:hypothetical protein